MWIILKQCTGTETRIFLRSARLNFLTQVVCVYRGMGSESRSKKTFWSW